MAKKFTAGDREWYESALKDLGGAAASMSADLLVVHYAATIQSDESHFKNANPEELAHGVAVALLHSPDYGYPLTSIGHEIHFAHGSHGSKADIVDVMVWDPDGLPYAMIELKAAHEFDTEKADAIKNQLFGTATLVGSPQLLVYATVEPTGKAPRLKAICIDYNKYKTYAAWQAAGEPHDTNFPKDYQDLSYSPFVSGGANDLSLETTTADFSAIASSLHNEFFGEHADNVLFVNLVKCMLAKIHDERTCKNADEYDFQVKYKLGKPESAADVFARVNSLYRAAYKRYIDPAASEVDEISPKEFAEDRVKVVVLALQGISITKGAAKHGDIIGTFFEQILRSGFKQDRGMYFTHDNLVRFMIEAVDLPELTRSTWQSSNHPENRLPYIMDPACGSGTFLLHAMTTASETIRNNKDTLVNDFDSTQYFKARLSDDQPNSWAESFIYGFDPKFTMAITAKVNMVLHGDGSAHVFKDDAFKPFSQYSDPRLKPATDAHRSINRTAYAREVCETFDVIVSNPPFGITISSETRKHIGKTFLLPDTTPSEGLFMERCYQLLKPGGRLAVVIPESLLNAKDLLSVRLFLYRFFHIRCVVSLPRNIFIDTPTLTSLLFAEKKTGAAVAAWDAAWAGALSEAETIIKNAAHALRVANTKSKDAKDIAGEFLALLGPLAGPGDWILKSGKGPSVLKFGRVWGNESGEEAAAHFREMLKTSGFEAMKQRFIFQKVVTSKSPVFHTFEVDEVGYKLSKRKERARPNPLAKFISEAGDVIQNLHLADGRSEVVVDAASPKNVLDKIRSLSVWSKK